MNFIAPLICMLVLLGFLSMKMYRMFSIFAGLYVGLWVNLEMEWDGGVSAVLAIVTFLFMKYIFHERGLTR